MLHNISTQIYSDSASLKDIKIATALPWIHGFTTNPTLMRKAEVTNYLSFAEEAIQMVQGKPISFEVFADDLAEMESQALTIASWGENVYVKIPITNTLGESTAPILYSLSRANVKLNVTAVFTALQVEQIVENISSSPVIISIFAGRIADTGRDPKKYISQALDIVKAHPQIKILWASCREIYNLIEANSVGTHIITMPSNLIYKLGELLGKDLTLFSLETVKMLTYDALAAGYQIPQLEVV